MAVTSTSFLNLRSRPRHYQVLFGGPRMKSNPHTYTTRTCNTVVLFGNLSGTTSPKPGEWAIVKSMTMAHSMI